MKLNQQKVLNSDGAKNLAEICAQFNTKLIHISTDFVFEGNIPHPLTERDLTNPISVYGKTKLDGENAIQKALNEHFILRTSWLYSEFGNNFVKTMLRLGETNKEIKVIADQVGTPTYAIDLAKCILEIIRQDSTTYGIYHYSNEGTASWYDFAMAIFELNGNEIKIVAYSIMDKTKIKDRLGIVVPYWRESLGECILKLNRLVDYSVDK